MAYHDDISDCADYDILQVSSITPASGETLGLDMKSEDGNLWDMLEVWWPTFRTLLFRMSSLSLYSTGEIVLN